MGFENLGLGERKNVDVLVGVDISGARHNETTDLP
jgi:hypothetical protein